MGDELEFRTAVGGYRKDDVLEYVENVNDMLFQMTRDHENETNFLYIVGSIRHQTQSYITRIIVTHSWVTSRSSV